MGAKKKESKVKRSKGKESKVKDSVSSFEVVWTCHHCNSGSLSEQFLVETTPACLNIVCQHFRCAKCPLERIEVLDMLDKEDTVMIDGPSSGRQYRASGLPLSRKSKKRREPGYLEDVQTDGTKSGPPPPLPPPTPREREGLILHHPNDPDLAPIASDSGYASRIPEDFEDTQEAVGPSPQPGTVCRDAPGEAGDFEAESKTIYSDAGSLAGDDKVEVYVSELARSLVGALDLDRLPLDAVHRMLEEMPRLLKTFGRRVGSGTPSQMHCDVMYFLVRYRL